MPVREPGGCRVDSILQGMLGVISSLVDGDERCVVGKLAAGCGQVCAAGWEVDCVD